MNIWALLTLFATLSGTAGCSVFSPQRTVFTESPQGMVLLEEVPDRGSTAAFRRSSGLDAAHPVSLNPSILAAALRGVQISARIDEGGGPTGSPPSAVFNEPEVALLAPAIGAALLQARPSQVVLFRVRHDPPGQTGPGADVGPSPRPAPTSVAEVTSGGLYLYGRSLYLTLLGYRDRTGNLSTAFPTGADGRSANLVGRQLTFQPAAALRPESYRQSRWPSGGNWPSLIIDYSALSPQAVPPPLPSATTAPARVHPPSPPSAPPAPVQGEPTQGTPGQPPRTTAEEMRDLKDLVIKKDLELERLREELHQLRRHRDALPPR